MGVSWKRIGWASLAGTLATAAIVVALGQVESPLGRARLGLAGQLATDWALLLLFAAGALVGGAGLMARLSPRGDRDGFWPLAFVAGVAVFGVAMGALGWVGLLGPATVFALPLAMIGLGWNAAVEQGLMSEASTRRTAWHRVAIAFGAVCLFLVGLQTLSPENVNYDAAWYHLRSAERNALAGRMAHTPEGDQLLTLPQLNAWLYTWAFLHPAGVIDQKVRLALLLELATFAGTLALLPPLVRALVPALPRERTTQAWVALFLFPSIFIYDTGIMGGADHVVALFSTGVLLAWLRAREREGVAPWLLLGVLLVGLLAKYSSLYLLVPWVPVVLIDRLWRRRGLRGPMVAAAVALILALPYWGKNLAWHDNPVYPLMSSVFPSAPWNEDAAAWQLNYEESNDFHPPGARADTLARTAQALFDYQARIYSWPDMTGGQPIFGVSYFLSLLALPFIAGGRRLWLLALLMHAGIAVWFNTHQHHMRYLTVLMAPMAAGAAAVAAAAWGQWPWRLGKLAVLGSVLGHLVAFGTVPFRKTHRMARRHSTVSLAGEYLVKGGGRPWALAHWEQVGASLPSGAKPLVHGIRPHLGLGRQSVTDVVGLQYGINYGRWGSLADVHRNLREMGVTHLVWGGVVEQGDSIAGEALFAALASRVGERQVVNGYSIGELPHAAPEELEGGVLYVGCGGLFRSGLYARPQLVDPVRPRFHPLPDPAPMVPLAPAQDAAELIARADWLVREEGCPWPSPPGLEHTLVLTQAGAFSKPLQYFVRTVGRSLPMEPAP